MIDWWQSSGALLWLGDPACAVAGVAGGKGASLSRMVAAGVSVPPGFVVCPDVFARAIVATPTGDAIAAAIAGLDAGDTAARARASRYIRDLIVGSAIPDDVAIALAAAYNRLGGPVAVRSSAIAEDSPTASYAGQQETFLDVVGAEGVLARVRDCWASFFSEHAIFYRQQKGSLADLRVAVVVQRLIVPEKAGVMFTVDPIQRRRDRLVVEAVWGVGEALVSGLVTPDNYQVARADARVMRAFVPAKPIAIARDDASGRLQRVDVPAERRLARVLSDDEIARLVALGVRLEEIFGTPQDVEWGIAAGTLYAFQSRPVTTLGGAPRGRGR